jgi:hypothetical protein
MPAVSSLATGFYRGYDDRLGLCSHTGPCHFERVFLFGDLREE